MRKEVEGIGDTFDAIRVTNVIFLTFFSGQLQNFVAIHPSRPKRNDVEGTGSLCNIEVQSFVLTKCTTDWDVKGSLPDLLDEYAAFHPDIVQACR